MAGESGSRPVSNEDMEVSVPAGGSGQRTLSNEDVKGMRTFLSSRGFGDETILGLGDGYKLLRAYTSEKNRAEQDKNKGGSIKKYAQGGSVRKTRLSDY